MVKIQGFLLYRIFYRGAGGKDTIVYVGRTKQPLQTRIRGHLFAKPMHRTISIEQVTKIEYARLQTEADMNLYEIYYILKEKPPLNVDDKTRDRLTVSLPELTWTEFRPPLWDKWMKELKAIEDERGKMRRRSLDIPQEIRVLRSRWKMGEITEDEYWAKRDALMEEERRIRTKLYG